MSIVSRPSWDQHFLNLAFAAGERSTCPSRKVGAVIVNPETKNIITMGFNGAPRGTSHCDKSCLERESGKDYHKCKAVHGEVNAIIAAAMNGVSTNGATIYLTTSPCIFCARILVNAGIKRVVAPSTYPGWKDVANLFIEADVEYDFAAFAGYFNSQGF